MKSLSAIVQEEEVARKNQLRFECEEQINAAIKTGRFADAVKFVQLIFPSIGLTLAGDMVETIRSGERSIHDFFIPDYLTNE